MCVRNAPKRVDVHVNVRPQCPHNVRPQCRNAPMPPSSQQRHLDHARSEATVTLLCCPFMCIVPALLHFCIDSMLPLFLVRFVFLTEDLKSDIPGARVPMSRPAPARCPHRHAAATGITSHWNLSPASDPQRLASCVELELGSQCRINQLMGRMIHELIALLVVSLVADQTPRGQPNKIIGLPHQGKCFW